MCGRRKLEREQLCNWGDMDHGMVESIAGQIDDGIVVQFHNNGEPLLYPRLAEGLDLFRGKIRCLDTNGKLLVDKAGEIISNLETITISTFQGDPEQDEQYEILKDFLRIKGDRKPNVIVRLLGNVEAEPYGKLGVKIFAKRILHSPMGSFDYPKPPTIPEIGICLDALSHLVIDRFGQVSMCVRFDPYGEGVIGDLNYETLDEIWNGAERQRRLTKHIEGKRDELPLCNKCEYWGVPTG